MGNCSSGKVPGTTAGGAGTADGNGVGAAVEGAAEGDESAENDPVMPSEPMTGGGGGAAVEGAGTNGRSSRGGAEAFCNMAWWSACAVVMPGAGGTTAAGAGGTTGMGTLGDVCTL